MGALSRLDFDGSSGVSSATLLPAPVDCLHVRVVTTSPSASPPCLSSVCGDTLGDTLGDTRIVLESTCYLTVTTCFELCFIAGLLTTMAVLPRVGSCAVH